MRLAHAAVLVVAVLLCAGCQARVALEVVVDRDGGGALTIEVGADAALLARAAEAGVDPLGDVAGTATQLAGDGWDVRDAAAPDGGRTVSLSRRFTSPEELASIADELAEALAAPELVPFEDLRLVVEDDLLRLSGVAGLVPTPAVTEIGLQPEQAVQVMEDTGAVDYEVRVTLPGDVVETNAAADGRELVWRIAPGERIALVAVGERPGAPWWPLAAAGAGGGVLALVLLGVGRRPRQSERRAA